MKLFIVLCLTTVVVCVAEAHSRGCIYINGQCSRECEEGTHAYTTGCDYLMPEATCDNPKPVLDQKGRICDFTACYCDEPRVRDTVSGKCVALKDCPKKSD